MSVGWSFEVMQRTPLVHATRSPRARGFLAVASMLAALPMAGCDGGSGTGSDASVTRDSSVSPPDGAPGTEDAGPVDPALVDRLAGEVSAAAEGTASAELQAAQARVQAALDGGELDYLAAVPWHMLRPELVLQDPVFRRAMQAAADPDRLAVGPVMGIGGSRQALTQEELVDWVRENMRVVAAVGVTAVGVVACVGSFTGVGAVACGMAIAWVASSMLPVNASEMGFGELPLPDTPADTALFMEHVDPAFACPAGYADCDGGFCTNLAASHRNCGACGVVCESGLCVDGACRAACGGRPGRELCDGEDNDCDGSVDEEEAGAFGSCHEPCDAPPGALCEGQLLTWCEGGVSRAACGVGG